MKAFCRSIHLYVTAVFASLLVVCFAAQPRVIAEGQPSTHQIRVGAHSMRYEVYEASPHADVILLLHGHSGPANYGAQAVWFQQHGFTVLLPHYTDVSPWRGEHAQDEVYAKWIEALRALIDEVHSEDAGARHIGIVGYSQGASLALAAGSQSIPVDAVVEWYGSLPDNFFARRKGMPPLLILHGQLDTVIPVSNAQQLMRLCQMDRLTCESHIYPGMGHGLVDPDLDSAGVVDADERTLLFLRKHFAIAD